jgi:hypothetical protein
MFSSLISIEFVAADKGVLSSLFFIFDSENHVATEVDTFSCDRFELPSAREFTD